MENAKEPVTVPEKRLLSIPEVQALTGGVPSRNTLYTLASQNLLPGVVKFGRRVWVSRVALEKALAEGWQPPRA